MKAQSVFLSGLMVLLLFNLAYFFIVPDTIWDVTQGAITSLVITLITVAGLSGIQFLGTGLNASSIKILFGLGAIISMLFSVDIGSIRFGMGLATNLLNAFSNDTALGLLGVVFTAIFSLMMITTGLIMIVGGGD